MENIKKILLTTDFSEASGDAMKLAVLLAGKNASHIHLLHVIARLGGWPVDHPSIVREANDRAQMQVEAIQREGLSDVDATVLFGHPVEEIVDQAELRDVSLILLGSGEKDKDARFPLGVTADNILRSSPRPVWVVKRGASEGIKKILCPVDFSEHSRRALANAMGLSSMFGAELQVLTVAEKVPAVYFSMGIQGANISKDWEKRTEKEFDKFLSDFDFSGLSWNKVFRSGKPHEEILKVSAETRADLLVMGSLGKTGLTRIFMGSVAEKIARELPCSLVMMKAHGMMARALPEKTKKVKARKRYESLEKIPRTGK